MLDFNRIQHKVNKDAAEVRVKVKLTNSIDEGLIYRGYLKPMETLGFVVDVDNHRLIPNTKYPDGPVFRI